MFAKYETDYKGFNILGSALDIDDEHHYITNMRDCSVRMESILLDVNKK